MISRPPLIPASLKLCIQSRAMITLQIGETVVLLIPRRDDKQMFHPVALSAGGFIYFLDLQYQPAEMRAIHTFGEHRPHVRIGREFAFLLGSALTKEGLTLTTLGGSDATRTTTEEARDTNAGAGDTGDTRRS